MKMEKTKNFVPLPQYATAHNLETAQEVPAYDTPETWEMEDQVTGFKSVEPLPHKHWINFPRNYGVGKAHEFRAAVVKFKTTWPNGESAWWTVDAAGFHKVW